jgi:hypothetical protein
MKIFKTKVYQITQGNLWCQKLWYNVSKTTLSSITFSRSPPHFPYHPLFWLHLPQYTLTPIHLHAHLQTTALATISICLHEHKCAVQEKIIHVTRIPIGPLGRKKHWKSVRKIGVQ